MFSRTMKMRGLTIAGVLFPATAIVTAEMQPG